MAHEFIPGQRWLSEAESDLGLGTVLDTDARTVTVVFPACNETRTYAVGNAPLSRAAFGKGDPVQDRQEQSLTITAVAEENGLRIYRVRDSRGVGRLLPEAELNDRMRLNRPQDRLLSKRLDQDTWFSLRYRSWRQAAEQARSPVRGLMGPRVSLIPHQLYIASEVGRRHAPRVLLADEVGLGKTIEAGMILHQLLLSEQANRVLIVVPEPLIHQWLVEMLRRFNLRFALFDAQRFAAIDEDNPFHSEQRVLCGLEFLGSRPEVARAVLAGDWDLLVVDEAHHLTWSEAGSSLEYDLIEALAAVSYGVLLLTATPEQLGRAGHFARLRLLDPARFPSYPEFLKEEAGYEPVAKLAARLLGGEALDTGDRAALAKLLGGDIKSEAAELIHKLVDRHGTGRVLYRNTRAAIPGFPGRALVEHPLPLPKAYRQSGEYPLTPERDHPNDWTAFDPRVPWLVENLQALAPHKVLLICAHAETVLELRDTLLRKHAIHAAVFHEGMEIVARDRAAAFFADAEEGSQLLICSEIGSEGRNFQFAHHLILFDLPLEPDLLEQRIGRLDRIGQTETIRLHAPTMAHSPGESLFHWYRDGLNAFTAICPAAGAVYAGQAERLPRALGDADAMRALILEARQLTAELNAELEAGRDRLLELHSHQPSAAAGLVRQIEARDQSQALVDYMQRYWDAFGVEHEPGPGRSIVLHPGRHMRHEHFPGLPDDGATVTFERADALAHEDREFLTWEHPMVRGAMDMLSSDELGSTALTVMSHPGIEAGALMLEMLFVVECSAPAELQAGRFLPPTCIRVLLDYQGDDRADVLGHAQLQGECLSGNRKLVEAIIESQKDRLRELIALGEQGAGRQGGEIVAEAVRSMTQALDSELERLQALARVNPNVRDDEIEYLATRRQLLTRHMQASGVRLDAIRLLVFR